MKKKNKLFILLSLILMFTVPTIVSAGYVANGQLLYIGGQSDDYVYSYIEDAIENNMRYNVEAFVKICGIKYSSGWAPDSASISKPRKLYCNETSHYDYVLR